MPTVLRVNALVHHADCGWCVDSRFFEYHTVGRSGSAKISYSVFGMAVDWIKALVRG